MVEVEANFKPLEQCSSENLYTLITWYIPAVLKWDVQTAKLENARNKFSENLYTKQGIV